MTPVELLKLPFNADMRGRRGKVSMGSLQRWDGHFQDMRNLAVRVI